MSRGQCCVSNGKKAMSISQVVLKMPPGSQWSFPSECNSTWIRSKSGISSSALLLHKMTLFNCVIIRTDVILIFRIISYQVHELEPTPNSTSLLYTIQTHFDSVLHLISPYTRGNLPHLVGSQLCRLSPVDAHKCCLETSHRKITRHYSRHCTVS